MRTLQIVRRKGNNIQTINEEISAIEVIRRNRDVIHFLINRNHVEIVSRYRWFYHNGYCATTDESGGFLYLTWLLLGRPENGYVLHHINGDPRDNRKCNIQKVTQSVNNFFKKAQRNNSTGRTGISRYSDGSIVALVGPNSRRKHFKTMQEAIKARTRYERSMERAISQRCE